MPWNTRDNFERNFPATISVLLLVIQYMWFAYQTQHGPHTTEDPPHIFRPSQLLCRRAWARHAARIGFNVGLHPFWREIFFSENCVFAYFAYTSQNRLFFALPQIALFFERATKTLRLFAMNARKLHFKVKFRVSDAIKTRKKLKIFSCEICVE